MRTKILIGLFALSVSCLLWFAHDDLRTDIGKSDDSDKKTGNTDGAPSKITLSFSNPLELAYGRLALGMDREEALAIVEEEYPINKNAKSYAVGRNADGAYVWRWEWENKTDFGATESAILMIAFTREGDCVMCRIADAVYEYKFDAMTIQNDLRTNSMKIY